MLKRCEIHYRKEQRQLRCWIVLAYSRISRGRCSPYYSFSVDYDHIVIFTVGSTGQTLSSVWRSTRAARRFLRYMMSGC